jgi:hypothetical protein
MVEDAIAEKLERLVNQARKNQSQVEVTKWRDVA